MGGSAPIPDHAIVVRCGKPPFDARPLVASTGLHPDGPYGFSVQSAPGVPFEDLAAECSNRFVGYTTAGAIRTMGYDDVPTSGIGYHATVVVPRDWDQPAAEALSQLFQVRRNPRPKRRS